MTVLTAPEMQRLYHWCRSLLCGRNLHHIAPAAGLSSIEAIREMVQPPPPISDWREQTDLKLERIEASLAAVASMAAAFNMDGDRPAAVGKEGSHDGDINGIAGSKTDAGAEVNSGGSGAARLGTAGDGQYAHSNGAHDSLRNPFARALMASTTGRPLSVVEVSAEKSHLGETGRAMVRGGQAEVNGAEERGRWV